MWKSKQVRNAVLLLALVFAGLSWIKAQSEMPEAVDVLCDPAEMVRQQTELAQSLETLSDDMETIPGEALDRLFKVGSAYQELALNCGYIPPDAASRAVGTDVERILRSLETISADPINGQVLYNSDELACYGCHVTGGEIAPHTEGTFTRLEATRLSDPALANYTPEQYLVESIVQPGHYLVPGYKNVMPTHFGSRLTLQELADLVVYLESQDGPSPE